MMQITLVVVEVVRHNHYFRIFEHGLLHCVTTSTICFIISRKSK